jgi:large repetitive protein
VTGRVTARCGFATPALVVLLAVTALMAVASARASDPTDSILTYGCDPPLPRSPTNCALWHTSPVTLRWTLVDPNFVPMPGSDCDTKTVSQDTTGLNVTCAVWDLAQTQVQKTATMRVDQTAPTMGPPAPERPPDHTGWWNHAVKWTFSGTDATSGIAGCDTITYSGPDVSAGDVAGNCSDVAGNSATAHATINYDATAPTVTAITPERSADQSGWWNHAVKWTLSGSDAPSGIAGCDTVTYSGPDSATGTVSGDCRDVAGNAKTGSTPIKYDATAPNVTGATPARPADRAGWWNHAVNWTFTGTDATSGVAGCDTVGYSGPDTATGSVNGNCRDAAGNSASGNVPIKYDSAPPNVTDATPERPADKNGWWNHAVRWTFQGNDALSGLSDCDTVTYSGPDASAGTVTGSCRDVAGNAKSGSKTLKYDGTGPSITGATPARPADKNGWWNHSVTWSFQGTDALSGMEGCDSVPYAGPDSGTGDVSGACRDLAGNSSTGHSPIKYDGTAPTTPAGTPNRPADHSGWWNHPVNVAFTATDATSGISDCDSLSYSGPDQGNASVSGACRDNAGNAKSGTRAINYDATAPTVTAGTPQRPTDRNGWWNHPIAFVFSGTDATSDIESCDTISYSGPDAAGASVTGACRDNAGNSATRQATGINYDATAPTITGIGASRPSDKNGWWNHAVTVTASGTDARSGMDSCDSVGYPGPDNPAADVQAGCRDLAGNTATAHMTLKYDGTPPSTPAGTPDRPADHNGWWNHPLNVAFASTDATSGIASCDTTAYSGPDAANTSVSGDCRDMAGNAKTGQRAINYDATAPTVTAGTPQRPADRNGWWNHPIPFVFSGTDATSNIEGCDTITYSGPDAASGSVTGACRDNAGNSATRQATGIKYDATPPTVTGIGTSRPADSNGWWNHAVTVTATGTDARSGLDSCDSVSYSTPDSTAADVEAGCRDLAGNTATQHMTLKYDGTAPTITTMTPDRPPDHGVWWNKPVNVAFAGTDAMSGIASCDTTTYSKPDAANGLVSGVCRDNAGNAKTGQLQINYDATPPTNVVGTHRPADHNGWWNRPVTIAFTGSDATSNIASCDTKPYSGPDTGAISISGQCTDNAGNSAPGSADIKYDATPPQVTAATPDRPPDHNGWWNHPVSVAFTGTDATSKIENCDTVVYAGPDNPAADVTGVCHDNAGNNSTPADFGVKYDATPPTLTALPPEVGSNQVVLHWTASQDTVDTQVVRSPGIGTAAASTVYTGGAQTFTDPAVTNGVTYTYSVNVSDAAGNVASSTLTLTPGGSAPPSPDAAPAPVVQAAPASGVVATPTPTAKKAVKLPNLKWRRVKGADYYNFQLYRGNKKILTTWLTANEFQLRSSWVFHGRRMKLTDARYDWYVWPGFGKRSLRRYGHLITHQRFTFSSTAY